MASEVQTLDPAGTEGPGPAIAGPAAILAQLRSLGPGRILALGVVALALLGFFAFVLARSLEQPYTLLYGGLAPEDARRIVERLEAAAVPYRLSAGGDAVLVPADRALRLRMDLAEQGLPSGGSVGYELFDDTRAALLDGRLTMVLSHPVEAMARETLATLIRTRLAGPGAGAQSVTLNFDIHTAENI